MVEYNAVAQESNVSLGRQPLKKNPLKAMEVEGHTGEAVCDTLGLEDSLRSAYTIESVVDSFQKVEALSRFTLGAPCFETCSLKVQ